MKIWVRIALFVVITAMVLTESVFYYLQNSYEEDQVKHAGEKLKVIALLSARTLGASKLDSLHLSLSDSTLETSSFTYLNEKLNAIKTELGMNRDIYTFYLVDSNIALYGATSNPTISPGDTLRIVSKIRQQNLWNVYNNKEPLSTPIYSNDSGTWVAGMAPVVDSNGNVIAVVSTSLNPDSINAALGKYKDNLLILRIVFFSILIVISILISRQISRPISDVVTFMENVSFFGKATKLEAKYSGEVGRLVNATNEMYSKLQSQYGRIRRFVKELNKAHRKAQSLHKMEQSFLMIISHELRTPLVGMSSVSLLKEEIQNAKFEDENIKKDILNFTELTEIGYERLREFVQYVLDYICYSSDQVNLSKEKISYHNLIEEVISDMEENNNLKLNIERIPVNETPGLNLDLEKTKFLLSTIISKVGKLSVSRNVMITEFLNERDELVIEFSTYGEGVAKMDIPNFWEPFRNRNILNTGEILGIKLALVKLIVEAQGGKIKVSQDVLSNELRISLRFKLHSEEITV